MNRNAKISTSLLAAAAAAIAITGTVFAAEGAHEDDDAVASLAQARLSLVQAVDVAQNHTGGRATRAELGSENGAPVFEIEVAAADQQLTDVTVDAVAGKVLSTRKDTNYHGESHDEKDVD
ncbi:MAG: PepSY domain-containing protein [Burkholderiales bacterium]|nr:PepSY domain-containing protein [Burkholderiales bacterium]